MLLVVRHDKETEQITRHNERLAKAQEDRQRSDRSRLPKWQRNDAKTRESMYKGLDIFFPEIMQIFPQERTC